MPIYEYRCCHCGKITERFMIKYKYPEFIICECGYISNKIISLPNTDLVNNERLSSTMGVNPKQIKEAEKLYPGSKYTPDGKLIVENRKDKKFKLKQRGLSELD